jgi:DNA-binding CsgD family transcriptional regulator
VYRPRRAPPASQVIAARTTTSRSSSRRYDATHRLLEHVAGTLPGAPIDDSRLAVLSDRERAILLELARGLSNAEIAAALHLAEPTVKTYLGRLRAKLDPRDRVHW